MAFWGYSVLTVDLLIRVITYILGNPQDDWITKHLL